MFEYNRIGADTATNLLSIPVDLLRGDVLSAVLDAISAIPAVGEIADIAKVIDKAVDAAKAVDKASDVAKAVDKTSTAVQAMDKASNAVKVARKTKSSVENISPTQITPTHSLTLSKKKYSDLVDSVKKMESWNR